MLLRNINSAVYFYRCRRYNDPDDLLSPPPSARASLAGPRYNPGPGLGLGLAYAATGTAAFAFAFASALPFPFVRLRLP